MNEHLVALNLKALCIWSLDCSVPTSSLDSESSLDVLSGCEFRAQVALEGLLSF